VKFYDDTYYKNSFYALVGGLPSKSLMKLEILLLHQLEFELFVETSLYSKYRKSLQGAVIKKPSSKLKFDTKSSRRAGRVQPFESKVVSTNLSFKEREMRYCQSTKPVNMRVTSRPIGRNIHHHGEKSNNKSTRSQPELVNLPGHCFGMKMYNWEFSCRP